MRRVPFDASIRWIPAYARIAIRRWHLCMEIKTLAAGIGRTNIEFFLSDSDHTLRDCHLGIQQIAIIAAVFQRHPLAAHSITDS